MDWKRPLLLGGLASLVLSGEYARGDDTPQHDWRVVSYPDGNPEEMDETLAQKVRTLAEYALNSSKGKVVRKEEHTPANSADQGYREKEISFKWQNFKYIITVRNFEELSHGDTDWLRLKVSRGAVDFYFEDEGVDGNVNKAQFRADESLTDKTWTDYFGKAPERLSKIRRADFNLREEKGIEYRADFQMIYALSIQRGIEFFEPKK